MLCKIVSLTHQCALQHDISISVIQFSITQYYNLAFKWQSKFQLFRNIHLFCNLY